MSEQIRNKDLDLYDREIAAATNVMMEMNKYASRMRNTPDNLREFGKRCQDAFYQIGLVANVDLSKCTIIDPKTGRTYPPEIQIIARVDDPGNYKEFDHDEKRFEVIDAKARGEDRYRGIREKVNKPRNSSA